MLIIAVLRPRRHYEDANDNNVFREPPKRTNATATDIDGGSGMREHPTDYERRIDHDNSRSWESPNRTNATHSDIDGGSGKREHPTDSKTRIDDDNNVSGEPPNQANATGSEYDGVCSTRQQLQDDDARIDDSKNEIENLNELKQFIYIGCTFNNYTLQPDDNAKGRSSKPPIISRKTYQRLVEQLLQWIISPILFGSQIRDQIFEINMRNHFDFQWQINILEFFILILMTFWHQLVAPLFAFLNH